MQGSSNINLSLFVCFFDIYRASWLFPYTGYHSTILDRRSNYRKEKESTEYNTIHKSKICSSVKHVHIHGDISAQQTVEVPCHSLCIPVLERYSPIVYPSGVELRVDQGTRGLKESLVFKALFSTVSHWNKEIKTQFCESFTETVQRERQFMREKPGRLWWKKAEHFL